MTVDRRSRVSRKLHPARVIGFLTIYVNTGEVHASAVRYRF